MSVTPYPEYSAAFTKVPKIGGLDRNCFVVEVRAETLPGPVLALVQERLELILQQLARSGTIESAVVAGPERFDTPLRRALRL